MDIDGRRLVGRVTAVSSSGLTLVQRGQATSVPLQRVVRITVSDSNRNGALKGALIGAAIGAAGGVAVNAICANESGDCFGVVLVLAGAGAASGAGIGWLWAALGSLMVARLIPLRRRFLQGTWAVTGATR